MASYIYHSPGLRGVVDVPLEGGEVKDGKVDLRRPGTDDVVVSGCPVEDTGRVGTCRPAAVNSAQPMVPGAQYEGTAPPAGRESAPKRRGRKGTGEELISE